MASKSEVATILAVMSCLPNSPFSGVKERDALIVEAHYLVLKDFDIRHLQAAAAQYLSEATFFPTPGNLRQSALDLVMSARGIPTAAEAWASVQDAWRYVYPFLCREGERLTNAALEASRTGEGYWTSLAHEGAHKQACLVCKPGGFREVYSHPVVAEAVRSLGGRDNLFTDNPASDRARFIDAYREIVMRERKDASHIPEVTAFIAGERDGMAGLIEERNAAFDTGEKMDILAGRMRK